MSRRRRGSDEINLTPLLDVLFSILFIVMLTSTQSEQSLQEVQAQTQDQIEAQQEQIEALEAAARSEELYGDTAVIVTMRNTVRRDGTHQLTLTLGREAQTLATIQMGQDRPAYIRQYVRQTIEDLRGEAEGKPLFIAFYCRSDLIYRQEEFLPIQEELERLSRSYKEVFYQILEE